MAIVTTTATPWPKAAATNPKNGKPDATGCFDNWICVFADTYDDANQCKSRTLIDAKTSGASALAQCFRSWQEAPQAIQTLFFDSTGSMKKQVCVAALGSLNEVACTTSGAILLSAGSISNPISAVACRDFCKASTHGAAMPAEVRKAVDWAYKTGSCGDFLQAELTQQCLSAAQEQ